MEIIIKGALVNSNLTNRFLNILNQDVKEGVEYCLQPTEGKYPLHL